MRANTCVKCKSDLTRLPTMAQLEVIRLLSKGLTESQVAARLGTSTHTVKHHLTHTYQRIGVKNMVEAAVFCVREGLI